MKKILLACTLCLIPVIASANKINFADYFKDKSACFMVFNLKDNILVAEYNDERCKKRMPPDSTFKVPISLMAFDQKLISQDTVFKWDGKDRGLAVWNQEQTPQSWLKNSAVWVSQELTPKLGLAKIKTYLKNFDYGNQDFSGDPGQNNGLTHAWLNSSLKISGEEQLEFLKKFFRNQLPVSADSINNTKTNMLLETSPKGWKLYGKTGSAVQTNGLEDGWFVGEIEKNGQQYVFVTNFTDLTPKNSAEMGGTRAKNIVKTILNDMQLW